MSEIAKSVETTRIDSKTAPVGRRGLPWSVIGAAALLVRVLYLQQAATSPLFAALQGDAETYDRWARRIAAGDIIGTETFYQAPLYPYFLACVYAVTGGGVAAARCVQIVLGAAGCVLLGKAAERWFDRRTGLVTATILAFQPPAIFFDGVIQKTSLEAFLTTALLALLAFARNDGGRRLRLWFSAGLMLGLLCLARENTLVWLPIVLGAAAWPIGRASRKPHIAAALCCAIGIGIPLSITATRNYYVGGELQITTSQFGSNFFIGNHVGAKGLYEPLRPHRGMTRYERTDAVELAELAVGRKLTAGEVSRYWSSRVWTWIKEHPGDWLQLMVRKVRLAGYAVEIGDTEDQYAYADSSWLLRVLDRLGHFGILAPLAAVGIMATWRRRRELAVPYLLFISYTAALVLFYIFSRYRFPLVLLLIPFAAAGIVATVDAAAAGLTRRLAVFAAIGLVTAAVANNRIDNLTADRFAAMSYFNLSAALVERGDVEGARRTALVGFERDEEALLEFAGTLQGDPRFDLSRALLDLGESFLAQGRKQEALDAFKQGARHAPPETTTSDRLHELIRILSAE